MAFSFNLEAFIAVAIVVALIFLVMCVYYNACWCSPLTMRSIGFKRHKNSQLENYEATNDLVIEVIREKTPRGEAK